MHLNRAQLMTAPDGRFLQESPPSGKRTVWSENLLYVNFPNFRKPIYYWRSVIIATTKSFFLYDEL